MRTGDLSLDQAPPIAVPLTFFATAPVAMIAAGGLLISRGATPLLSNWLPESLALTHIGTLGVLAMAMFGALYQMIPVVAGTPVPAARLSHLVHVLLSVGVVGLVWGLLSGGRSLHGMALLSLAAAVILFLVPIGIALVRAPTRSATVDGMRLAVFALFLVVALGLWMAWGVLDGTPPSPRPLWLQVHLTIGLLGWVGGLITAVSWQVVPMFYLGAPVDPRTQRIVLVGIGLGIALPLVVLAAHPVVPFGLSPTRLAALGALPAAAAVWIAHPLLVLRSLRNRRRPRADSSMRFWQAATVAALIAAAAGIALPIVNDPRLPVLFGWLVIWGWAAMVVHGMLARIVPFLVWFHRFSPHVGLLKVPSMRELLPNRHVHVELALHLVTLALGLAAIATGSHLAARACGATMALTGLALAAGMARVLSHPAPT